MLCHLINMFSSLTLMGIFDSTSFPQIGELQVLLEEGYDSGETRVRVPMTRLYGNSILTIYIPSLILMIISYLTLFFRTSIFDVRVMVALTALLVLATLFAQVRTLNFLSFLVF